MLYPLANYIEEKNTSQTLSWKLLKWNRKKIIEFSRKSELEKLLAELNMEILNNLESAFFVQVYFY